MMRDNSICMTLPQPCDEAVDWMVNQMNQTGFSVIRTFDLKLARDAQMNCPCPQHGTELCDCQVVVLLIYAGNKPPVALIAHGSPYQTWFSVVDTPQQRADPEIDETIRGLFIPPSMAASMI